MIDNYNYLLVCRGAPGSGKSTLARLLINAALTNCDGISKFEEGCPSKLICEISSRKSRVVGVIHSTDQYFINKTGEYVFDSKKLGEYHGMNYQSFCESIAAKIPMVVLDNTNTQKWEYKNYLDTAREAGYAIAEIILPHPTVEEAVARNKHGVPASAINRMIKRFQP